MKRVFTRILIFVVMAFVLSCSRCEKRRVDLLTILPQNTQNLILIPNIQETVNGIMQFLRLFEKGVAYESLKKEIELASAKLGINLLDPKDIKAAGFDPTGSLGVVSVPVNIGGRDQMVNLLIMSYLDRSRAEATLNRLAREKEKTDIFKSKSYMGARIVTAIRQSPRGEKPVLVYAFYNGFVIYGIPEKGEPAIRRLINTRLENSLSKSQYYLSLVNRVEKGQAYFFINSGKNIKAGGFLLNKEMRSMLNSVKENFNGMVISLAISRKGINLSTFIGLSDKSVENLNKYLVSTRREETDALLRIVPENPFLLTRLNLNFSSLYTLMKEEEPSQMMIIDKRLFGLVLKYMEVDVENDILPLIKGSLVYSVSPGELQNINSAIKSGFKGEAFNKLFNVYYSMNLSNRERAEEFLKRLVDSMRHRGQTVELSQIKDISISSSRFGAAFNSYWFIKDSNFYAFYTAERAEKVVSSIMNHERALSQSIPQSVRDVFYSPSAQVVYLNFAPLREIMDNISEERLNSIASTGAFKFGFVLAKEVINKLDSVIFYMLPTKDGASVNIGVNIKG